MFVPPHLKFLAGSIKIPSYNPAFGDSGIPQQPLLYRFMWQWPKVYESVEVMFIKWWST